LGSEALERLYRVFPWPEDPYSEEGRARYEEALEAFARVVDHRWFRERVEGRQRIKVVDFCSGTGIGGVALARVVKEKLGASVNLLLVDLRRSALEVARRFSRDELGFEAETLVADVTEPLDLGEKFDVAVLWGLATPHFSPWSYVRFLSNVIRALTDQGLYVYDEGDRLRNLIYLKHRDVVVEASKDRFVLNIHADYDYSTGLETRVIYDPATGERAELKVHLWSLAASAAMTWIFFEDVDFIPFRAPYSGIILAVNPRRGLDPGVFLSSEPSMLRTLKRKP